MGKCWQLENLDERYVGVLSTVLTSFKPEIIQNKNSPLLKKNPFISTTDEIIDLGNDHQ